MEAENGLKFYFLVSGRLFMSTFWTGTHVLLLTPVTGDRKVWSHHVYTCFVSSKIPPKAVGEAYSVPTCRLPSWGRWRSWGSLPFSQRTPISALVAETRPPLIFRRRSSYVIAHGTSVCLSSVVCDVAPYSEGWTFRQYFAPSNSIRTRAVWIEILEKN